MIMGIVVPRWEIETINSIGDWILIYGRRKTGKSFIVRNFVKFDEYYFVSRSGRIYELYDDRFRPLSRDVFLIDFREAFLKKGQSLLMNSTDYRRTSKICYML